ncbi:MAG: galactokinase [Flavobacteriaceae bacterium]|nr:galactokinase [Flavobacteriaceae bacterium]|tara:strand:- start:4481 stop:5560 length:1080 start_codon:yes stop_codon:yes gene_type:complete
MNFKMTSKAPGRICLFGDHQDYLKLPIIACAINRYVIINAERNDQGIFNIQMNDLNQSLKIPIDKQNIKVQKDDYLVIALKVLRRHGCIPNSGYNISISGDIPINAGLSSSSALTIAWINFLVAAFGIDGQFNSIRLAKLAYETEVIERNSSGGKMDQFTISLGNLIYLNTEDDSHVLFSKSMENLIVGVSGIDKDTFGVLALLKTKALEAINQVKATIKDFEIKNSQIEDLEKYLALVDLDLKPYLSAGIKNYFITKAAYSELQKGSSDINYLGDLMNKHHLLLRDNLKITVPRIDAMIENSIKAGAIGAKIIGSGGGGCIVAISEPGNEEKIISEIKKAGAVDAFLIKESEGAIVCK